MEALIPLLILGALVWFVFSKISYRNKRIVAWELYQEALESDGLDKDQIAAKNSYAAVEQAKNSDLAVKKSYMQ